MSHAPHTPRVRDDAPPRPVDVIVGPFQRFASFGASGSILLLLCSIAALVWANSPWGATYVALWQETTIKVGFGGAALEKPVVVWINDLLMAAFFFLVGLEIKREIMIGELASPKRAAMPLIAAVGGMVVPGLIYAAFDWGKPSIRGWGIPTATDIAFALGFLALLGSRVPIALRVFLSTLAIADDLGALIIIAAFYTEELAMSYMLYAAVATIVLAVLNMLGVRRAWPFAVVAAALWFFVLKSGVHATIAGVIAAMFIPATMGVDTKKFITFTRDRLEDFEKACEHEEHIARNPRRQAIVQAMEDACDHVQTPLHKLEHALLPWVAFLILPIFALSNAGVNIKEDMPKGDQWLITLGAAVGLALGKPIGITLASLIAVKLGVATLPRNVTWMQLHGAAWLAGIGFTMSLFIAGLAFPDGHALAAAKIGVLGGSLVAAVVGLLILWKSVSGNRNDHGSTQSKH